MSKKTAVKSNKPEPVVTPKAPSVPQSGLFGGMPFFKNFVQLLLVITIVIVCMRGNEGYSWVWTDLIQENLAFISKNKNLTTAQRYQAKFGVDAAALDYIRSKTPDTAVILFPPYHTIISDSSGYQFIKGLGGIKMRIWSTYFLYPRKLVYFDEIDKSVFKSKISHVVCMGNWGYTYISYSIPDTEKRTFDVYPVTKKASMLPSSKTTN